MKEERTFPTSSRKWGGSMKILRLSLFNLKRNKREVLGIIFMTMITALMLTIVLVNYEKIDTAFAESFEASGSVRNCVFFKEDTYRERFKSILEEEYDVEEVSEGHFIYTTLVDTYSSDGDVVSYNFSFVTEGTERKIESFRKLDHLPEEEIAALPHPIWLPASFCFVKGFDIGDSFTIIKNGEEYPFTIAGFYETGLMNSDGYTYKLVIPDEDYELFAKLFESAFSWEGVGLFFNAADFDYDGYLEKCNDTASENLSAYTIPFFYEYEKDSENQFLTIFLYMFMFFALVTMVAAAFMIRHKVTGDIEDQMQRIGVLEALGYRSKEISLAYLFEYVIMGGVGAVLGSGIALTLTHPINLISRQLLGRSVNGTGNVSGALLSILAVVVLVVLFALFKVRTVKNYPPVEALRKGIKTHHFGRNILPLDKLSINVNAHLALKGLFGNLKTSLGICICILAAGTAFLFATQCFDFFKDGPEGLISMIGYDSDSISVHIMSGRDIDEIRDEILSLPEARKALTGYDFEQIAVKGSSDSAQVNSFGDFNDAENVIPYKGRFPKHDNEVMIAIRRSRDSLLDVGDSIVLEYKGLEKSYVITGIVGSMQNGGTVVYLTNDGYERLNIMARKNVIRVYPAEGVSISQLEKAVDEHFGGNAKDAGFVPDAGDGLEDKIHKAVRKKIAVMLNQYGVTDVDYAVKVGDEVITGNSREFAIKEITNFEGIIKTQMVPIAETTKKFTFLAMLIIGAIVAVLLAVITSNDVRRQRHRLGIMKSLGYSSQDLMIQLTLKLMPVVIFGMILASLCAIWVNKMFWGVIFATVAETDIFVILISDVLFIAFCYLVIYISSGRIRKISVTELITE